jgi:hypothetical protein
MRTLSAGLIFVFLQAATINFANAQTIKDPRNFNGVWLYKVGMSRGIKNTTNFPGTQKDYTYTEFKKAYPFIQGILNPIMWRKLEPRPGKFNWNDFDASLNIMANAGFYINLMIWVGPSSPEWLYTDMGVEKVFTDRKKENMPFYPNYKNPVYKERWYKMIDAVAAHIETLPKKTRNNIIIYQSAEGTTGDEGPFKGASLEGSTQYYFTTDDAWWVNFKRDEWKHLYDIYTIEKNPPVHLIFNGTESDEELKWIKANTPNIWKKANNIGHVYQANADAPKKVTLDPLINVTVPGTNKTKIRVRDEFDVHQAPTYAIIPTQYAYWTALHSLHFGLDMWATHNNEELFDPANRTAFEFFQKYGGYKNPAFALGAFCALRDGLDANDFKRFPAEKFGAGTLENKKEGMQRTVNIAKAFAKQGAKQGDPRGSMGGQTNNHHAKAINDVNWNIFRSNYQRYITQYNPNETSIGYWSVGNIKQPEGRFARGFDHTSGKDAMYFNVDDKLFKNFPNNGAKKVKIRISYFDNGGKWKLVYDAVNNKNKTAYEQTNTNTGKWKDITIPVTDAYFGNRLEHGTDIALINSITNGKDAIFHMVEVIKE